MSNIWFNLQYWGEMQFGYMLVFLTQTLGNSFDTAPELFLVFRKFRPNSILSWELWSGTAAWAGSRAGIWGKLCCLQELEGLNPETAVVWAVMREGEAMPSPGDG